MLNITKTKIYPYKKRMPGGVIAIGQVVFEGGLLLSGLELVERNNKRFIVYPKNPNNNHDLCYCQPTNKEMNKFIADALFTAYDETKTKYDENIICDPNNKYWEDAINDFANEVVEQQAVAIALNNSNSTGPEPSGENIEVVEDEETNEG